MSSVDINDGRARDVSFITDEIGQIIERDEVDNNAALGDPRAIYYRFAGREMGITGNDGGADPDYASSIDTRTSLAAPGSGAFAGGNDTGVDYADFDGSYQSTNSFSSVAGLAGYVVRAGDTLQGIAAGIYGDASLWYKIAGSNGLTGAEPLTPGTSLTLPAGITRSTNNAASFKPYDPARAIGDVSPNTPSPPKGKDCGIAGQILLVAIAVAVTALTAGSAAAALGPVLGGALAGAAGSVASQGFGVASGLQDKFSFAGVAAAGVGGGVGAWVGSRTDSFGDFGSGVASSAAGAIANAATRSAIEGSNFGDNLVAATPDVVGGIIGRAVGSAGVRAIARATAKTRTAQHEAVHAQANSNPAAQDGHLNTLGAQAEAAITQGGGAVGAINFNDPADIRAKAPFAGERGHLGTLYNDPNSFPVNGKIYRYSDSNNSKWSEFFDTIDTKFLGNTIENIIQDNAVRLEVTEKEAQDSFVRQIKREFLSDDGTLTGENAWAQYILSSRLSNLDADANPLAVSFGQALDPGAAAGAAFGAELTKQDLKAAGNFAADVAASIYSDPLNPGPTQEARSRVADNLSDAFDGVVGIAKALVVANKLIEDQGNLTLSEEQRAESARKFSEMNEPVRQAVGLAFRLGSDALSVNGFARGLIAEKGAEFIATTLIGLGAAKAVQFATRLNRVGGGKTSGAGAPKFGVPGRVQSRINISNKGFTHLVGGHFDPLRIANKSQFSISQSELRSILGAKNTIQSPVTALSGKAFTRTVEFDRSIGTLADKFGGGSTNFIRIHTDRYGNLTTAFPFEGR